MGVERRSYMIRLKKKSSLLVLQVSCSFFYIIVLLNTQEVFLYASQFFADMHDQSDTVILLIDEVQ